MKCYWPTNAGVYEAQPDAMRLPVVIREKNVLASRHYRTAYTSSRASLDPSVLAALPKRARRLRGTNIEAYELLVGPLSNNKFDGILAYFYYLQTLRTINLK